MRLPAKEPYPAQVYIMQARDTSVKVGISNVPEARRNEVCWMNGGGVVLLWASHRVRYPTVVERRVREILCESHLKGEWYSCSAIEAKRAVDMAIADVERHVATANVRKARARK